MLGVLSKMERFILKEDGTKELFNEEKIKISLLRAGANEKIASSIVDKVKEQLTGQCVKTKDVYRLALGYLKKRQPAVAIKYTLKKAMMNLGPTGYIFEKYIAKILQEYDFKTQVGKIVKGFCVEHEIDVIAEKDNEHHIMECKYHNSRETKSDVKIALYIHARFLDIKKAGDEDITNYNFSKAWLVTNTKCTSEAISYANCVNLGIISWHYPTNMNLEHYIEQKKLYPISILPSLKDKQKDKLLENNILTIQDLLSNNLESICNYISADQNLVRKLFIEAEMLFT
jgi:hypothetical protein